MTVYRITFTDDFEAEDREAVYLQFLEYLAECVKYQDLLAFNIDEVEEEAK